MTDYHIPGAIPAFVSPGLPFLKDGVSYPGDWLDKAGPGSVGAIAAPTYDPATQKLDRDDVSGWRVHDLSAAQLQQTLDAAKVAALEEADRLAEQERRSLFAPGDGQGVVYQEKEREARDLLSGGKGPWLFLDAEAQACGIAIADLAARVVAAADDGRRRNVAIEARRRSTKLAIRAAGSPLEVADLLEVLRASGRPD